MLSLEQRIELLEADLKSSPPRITIYNDLPFAILRYEPQKEWQLRREIERLATRLRNCGKDVHIIALADLLWEIISVTEGLGAIVELEQQRGFNAAQEQITTYLSDRDWRPLSDAVLDRLRPLIPEVSIVFLTRAAALAPAIYHMSRLLDEMQGRTRVPTVLFYPGTLEGTTGLRFMAMKDREAMGNYRVRIYG
jgi:hypothetical protein